MKFFSIVGHHFGPKPNQIAWLFKSVVTPCLTFASVIWGNNLTAASIKQLNKISCLASTTLCLMWKTTPTTSLQVLASHPPLGLVAEAHGLSTWKRLGAGLGQHWNGKGKENNKLGLLRRWNNLTLSLPEALADEDMCERFYSWSSPFSHHTSTTTTNYNIEIHLAYTVQNNNNSVGWTLYLNSTKTISRWIMLDIFKNHKSAS